MERYVDICDRSFRSASRYEFTGGASKQPPPLLEPQKGVKSLFHLDDLVPSSGDEETAEEESVVMEFDLGSERPSFW